MLFYFLKIHNLKYLLKEERTCRNPKTGEEIKVPEKKVVKFRVGKGLAEKVAK